MEDEDHEPPPRRTLPFADSTGGRVPGKEASAAPAPTPALDGNNDDDDEDETDDEL